MAKARTKSVYVQSTYSQVMRRKKESQINSYEFLTTDPTKSSPPYPVIPGIFSQYCPYLLAYNIWKG